ncbi:undecaprenyl-diphosphatase [Deinobacterium chartae]|uniref:Undecaprenyl-diphosphatase n=1 Tax=Deinobacterium chartae TaxID=521158 RepID=A0A841I1Q7_9DEIO|nr:phosphatase PAP2 family protein [Deinobacterium chartae]MBB6098924.1 undecaprenyl-diphosphatase [Deinobacterium chartae]
MSYRTLWNWVLRRWSGLLLLFSGVLLPLVIFGAIAEDVLEAEPFPLEERLMWAIHGLSADWLNTAMLTLSTIGGGTVMAIVCPLLALAFWRISRRLSVFLLLALGGAALINLVLKLIFVRARPELWEPLVRMTDHSFPSGHAMFSMTLAVSLLAVYWYTPYRRTVFILGALYTLLMGFSRMYIGVHYPTDVLSGWLCGLAWTVGLVRILLPERKFKPSELLEGPEQSAAAGPPKGRPGDSL